MKRWSCSLLVLALLGLLAVLPVAPATAQTPNDPGDGALAAEPDAIHLKSGSFVPTPGVEPELLTKVGSLPATWTGLVQLDEIPDDSRRAALAAAGVELVSYVPNRAWIARITGDPSGLSSLTGVRWVGRLLAEDKVDPQVAAWPDALYLKKGGTVTVQISTLPDGERVAADAVTKAGGQVTEIDTDLGLVVAELPAGRVLEVAKDDAIVWIDVEPVKALFNDESRANTRADVVQAAPYNLDGTGVTLGIWDGGQIWAHPDFSARLTMVQTGQPFSQHATHVTGTMAGDGGLSASFGLVPNQLRGMATAADIVGYDFAGNTLTEHNGAINTHGIELSQNSWGYLIESSPSNNCSLYGDYDTNARGYDQIVTGQYGALLPIVFAAGNERNDGDCGMSSTPPFVNYRNVSPPSTAKNVITVGAINGDDDAMTDFSSWGPVDDGRVKPEIVAPGCNVAGVQSIPAIVSTLRDTTNNSWGYGGSCGTSMAAPAVSGNIGLLLERYRDICPQGGNDPRPATIKALLVHGARDLDDSSAFLNPGPDYASGYGALNIEDSIDLMPFHVEDAVGNGVTDTFSITVTQQEDLKVTLVWDDTPAVANAAVTLVNDLDLELVDPLGGIHRPWVLDPNNPSNAATTGVDNRNVVEQVVVGTVGPTLAGTWTVRVIGTSVPSGPQGYSLVSEHLTTTSCNGAPASDAWIMDKDTPLSPVDTGAEPNPDTTAMWISNQIWVNTSPTANNPNQHMNPEFGQTNYVFARVRNDGANTLHTVRAMVYYAHASTGLSWPTDWHLIGSSTVTELGPGGSVVIDPVEWDPPATGHYCLYVRLLTNQDGIGPEGTNVNVNTRNYDEIAWRNVNIVDLLPNSETGFTFLSRNVLRKSAEIELVFDLSRGQRGRTLLDDGATFRVLLDAASAQRLADRGIRFDGQGFERIDDLTLELVSPSAILGPWLLEPGEVIPFEIQVTGPPVGTAAQQKPYILDVNQNFGLSFGEGWTGVQPRFRANPADANVGGVRYEIFLQN